MNSPEIMNMPLSSLRGEAGSQKKVERGFKKLCEIVRGRLCPSCRQKFDDAMEHPPRLTPMPTAAPDSARAFVAAQRFWEILNAADICDHCREEVVLCIGDLVIKTLNAPAAPEMEND